MATLNTYLQTIDDLRNVEWSRTYLWDIKFGPGNDNDLQPGPPAPFNNWIPASDYSETAHISNTLVLPFYLSQYKFMQTGSNTDIQMSLHDDVYGTMYRWLSDWFRYCLDDSDGVATLQNAYRTLYVIKLDGAKNILKTYTYYVIPEGTITENLNSNSDTKIYNLSVAVVGRLNIEDQTSNYNQETSNDFLTTDQSQASGISSISDINTNTASGNTTAVTNPN